MTARLTQSPQSILHSISGGGLLVAFLGQLLEWLLLLKAAHVHKHVHQFKTSTVCEKKEKTQQEMCTCN